MTGVISSHNTAPMPPFTVRVRPIIGNGCRGGAHAAPSYTRGPYTSLGRGESMPRRSGAPVLMSQGSGKAEIVPDGAQGLGEAEIVP
jgi:hypothetical protein